jgi:hypothetical protein
MQEGEGEAKEATAAALRRRADRRVLSAPAGAMWKRAERQGRAVARPRDRPADRAAAGKEGQQVAQAAMVAEPVAELAAMVECPMRTFRSES